MSKKVIFSHQHVWVLAQHLMESIVRHVPKNSDFTYRIFPIPRGGVPVAYLLKSQSDLIQIVDDPEQADMFVDDLVDSGRTMEKWCDDYPGKPFMVLYDKKVNNDQDWIVFPWEKDELEEVAFEDDTIVGTLVNRLRTSGLPFKANDNISDVIFEHEIPILQAEVERRAEHFLRGLVIDLENDHNTVGTAHRIAKMYLNEVFKGRYLPAPAITDFPNAKGLDEMYMTGPITIRSACSHHFVPIIGKCWIGIVPGDRVIGLSKFNRIVDWIASRPQIQEELVMQIADFIDDTIRPKGLAVVIEATHMCMTWRGVKEPMAAKMTTNVMRGVFRDKPEARAEFMSLVAKG